ncbi:hypothetical protein AWU67_13815 [Microterricola viridarii]|uniref:HTH lacI-type domain-containing protein n=2 Tax=Microterricola viridarii TaxID=412690 RepID=A0A0Y0PIT5_9MICO|nr:hypothetical protein AWU67_13815 [Microterricola viridarii]
MKDVAQASGVSPATVSFVLNGTAQQTIAPATIERVKRAAEKLGYVPNGVARALREGSSRIVVLHVARLPHGGPQLADFIDGLDQELDGLGYTLLVRYGEREGSVERLVAQISPRAVIDIDWLYYDVSDDAADGGWESGLAAHSAVQIGHLAGAGHRYLALALGRDDRLARLAELRFRYAGQAAAAAGLPALALLQLSGAVDGDSAALAAFRVTHPDITAVAGLDDASALRVLAAAQRLGIAVPGELAVIGFGGSAEGELFSPSLTTVEIDTVAFGRRAARTALGLEPGAERPGPAVVIRRESA